MFGIAISFSFIQLIGAIIAAENCDTLGVLLYEDLHCKAVKDKSQACPKKYDCENFQRKPDSCLFKSKRYALGESISHELLLPSCNAPCFCANITAPTADFLCAVFDCPFLPNKEGCYKKYDLEGCCDLGDVCPPFEESIKCEVDGQIFKEGQRMYPKDTCQVCICQKGFDGKLVEPFCRPYSCATQVRKSEKLEKNCAPAYILGHTALCCPDTWICHERTDVIIKINPNVTANTELQCNFGIEKVELGYGIERTVEFFSKETKVKCECIMPPFLTCK